MKTKAVRLHGTNDLRLDEFELPPIKDDEILARVVTDSLCMSSHKLALQGAKHKRVRHDLTKNPVMIGHEFCGVIEKVGSKWAESFKAGERFAVQPAINYGETHWAIGYSYEYVGGDATFIVIPNEVMEIGCLLKYEADNFYMGSLAEPLSCIVGAFHAQYHTKGSGYDHRMGIAEGGALAILAGAGPMGLGAIDYALHGGRKPGRVVVADIDQKRLDRAAQVLSPDDARAIGIDLIYVNTMDMDSPTERLRELNGGRLFDDVFCFAPNKQVVELGDAILGYDGCLNFFAGPTDTGFSAEFNCYKIHYESHHMIGTSGGNTDDMIEALGLMAKGALNPVVMVTHIGGLDAVAATTIDLPQIPGGKKLIYTHKKLPLTAIDEFAQKGQGDPLFASLADICARHKGLWNKEAEDYLLEHASGI